MYYTLSLTVFIAQLANRASRTSATDFFSRGHDPYTLACKGRPPSTDVWTFLSVIVIVIDDVRWQIATYVRVCYACP